MVTNGHPNKSHSQIPMTVGGRGEKLTVVFPEILKELKEKRKGQLQLFTPTESRGIEDDVLAAADSNIVELYLAFKQSLKEQQFLEPKNACADFYYEKLSQEPQLEKLHSTMRRNYAAALQDDAQQVLNIMLKSGLTENILSKASNEDIYQKYPAYLERAAELLGKEHYMYEVLQARKYFFKGKIQMSKKDQRPFYIKALNWQPEMPHAMVEIIRSSEAEQLDSINYYFQQVTDLIPSWVEPYLAMHQFYWFRKDLDKAEEMLNLAEKTDSTSLLVWYKKAKFYDGNNNLKLAEKWYLKTLESTGKDICFPCAYNNLGIVYRKTRQLDKAEIHFKKAIEQDSTFTMAYTNLGIIYKDTRRFEESEDYYKKAILLNPSNAHSNNNLAILYRDLKRFKEAEEYFKKATIADETYWPAFANLGQLYQILKDWEESARMIKKAIALAPHVGALHGELGNAYTHLPNRSEDARSELEKALERAPGRASNYIYFAQWAVINNRPEEAWNYLIQAMEKGFKHRTLLKNESDFEPLKNDPKWKELMEKYFPNK